MKGTSLRIAIVVALAFALTAFASLPALAAEDEGGVADPSGIVESSPANLQVEDADGADDPSQETEDVVDPNTEGEPAEGETTPVVGQESAEGGDDGASQGSVVDGTGDESESSAPESGADTTGLDGADVNTEPAANTPSVNKTQAGEADKSVADDEQDVAATSTEKAAQAASVKNVSATSQKASKKAGQKASPKTSKKAAARKAAKKQALKNGWYYIQSVKNMAYVLTGIKSSSNACVQNDKAFKNQRWYLVYNSAKRAYTLLNGSSKKYLAVKGSGAGANVGLSASGKAKTSYWIVAKTAAGGYTLKSYAGNYLLGVNGGKNVKSGANADAERTAKSAGKVMNYQRWSLLPLKVNYAESNVSLANGYYTIALKKSNSKTVSIPGASKAAGKQAVTSSYDSLVSQKFIVHKNADKTYTLQSLASAKFLTVKGNKVVQAKKVNGADSQKWRAVSQGNGIAFVNVATGKALVMSGVDGAKVTAAKAANRPGQRLDVKRRNILDNGHFYIRTASESTKANVVTVNKGSKKAGAKLSAQKQTYYNENGTFKVKHIGGGIYTLQNVNSGKYLTASGKAVSQGASSKKAQWKPVMAPNGGIMFKNVASGKALSSKAKKGSAVRAAKASASSTQSFYVGKAQVLKGYQKLALKKILKRGSNTNYYLFVDVGVPRMMIWERANKNAEWRIKYDFIVAYGRLHNGRTITKLKDGTVRSRTRWLDSPGSWSAPYAVFWGGQWFHSRTHYWRHSDRVIDHRLGVPISAGCIRMEDKYSKWIYDHQPILKGGPVTVWKNGHF